MSPQSRRRFNPFRSLLSPGKNRATPTDQPEDSTTRNDQKTNDPITDPIRIVPNMATSVVQSTNEMNESPPPQKSQRQLEADDNLNQATAKFNEVILRICNKKEVVLTMEVIKIQNSNDLDVCVQDMNAAINKFVEGRKIWRNIRAQ